MDQFIAAELQKQYGIRVIDAFHWKGLKGYSDHQCLYILIPVTKRDEKEIIERFFMAQHMYFAGEKYVPEFMRTIKGSYIGHWENFFFVLLKLNEWDRQGVEASGRSLASFHVRGLSFPYKIEELNRTGNWKKLWEGRLENLEKRWQKIVLERPENEFEKRFVESFPYFSGLCENALQYHADTLLDEQPLVQDRGTVSHERFTGKSWSGNIYWKNPFDWVFDHPARDAAEWSRDLFWKQRSRYSGGAQLFLTEYQSILPFSPFGWRLFFSRLILPLHYMDLVEMFFWQNDSRKKEKMYEQLRLYTENTEAYEYFLKEMYDWIHVFQKERELPKLDWL